MKCIIKRWFALILWHTGIGRHFDSFDLNEKGQFKKYYTARWDWIESWLDKE